MAHRHEVALGDFPFGPMICVRQLQRRHACHDGRSLDARASRLPAAFGFRPLIVTIDAPNEREQTTRVAVEDQRHSVVI